MDAAASVYGKSSKNAPIFNLGLLPYPYDGEGGKTLQLSIKEAGVREQETGYVFFGL